MTESKRVSVEYSFVQRDENDVEIDLAEYRAWLGLAPDETIIYHKKDLTEYLNSGRNPVLEVTGFYVLEDFNIEDVIFDCG